MGGCHALLALYGLRYSSSSISEAEMQLSIPTAMESASLIEVQQQHDLCCCRVTL